MAKKLNEKLMNSLNLGLNTQKSKTTQQILNKNNELKKQDKEINYFLNKQLIKEKAKRIIITISSYENIENKFKEMKKSGFDIDKSTIYRNAINTIYENWKNNK
ncbi:hypothetical protein D6D54_08460 [Spiroplasma poulsonii]|uniref:Uncharacterized protein n=1 Tax=Spiroplasma poulsonii TaxID=2138 RepID=A0A3S0SK91_9MOLU|nr:hypothetical protein [Spiroplasma poulsonii]MBW3059462.1 hypothetical protein [Spiroplasma poulsonii]RUP75524.1 hypothetical protein D6D54_08460 [Spiroplasma poulsonii]